MNASRFDDVVRSLASRSSRRGVLEALAGGVLASLPFALGDPVDVEAKNKKKKRKKKKKKKQPACVPNCAGKTCGDDGCGGVCGTCTGGHTCQVGTCLCPAPMEFCNGACLPPCSIQETRNPFTCSCCGRPGVKPCAVPFSTEPSCCSGKCSDAPVCAGLAPGGACQFGGQCGSETCTNGVCT